MKRFRAFGLALLITLFYWIYRRLWFVRHIDLPAREPGVPTVYAHWHGDELLLIGAYAWRRMAVMASRSQDGEMLTRILTWLGYRVVRGSSSRGGAGGLKGLVDAVQKEGLDASLAVDGPRGPVYRVKPGVLWLAQQSGCVLVPGAAACSRRFVFKKAWNQCYLPLPFSRCVVVYGAPLRIPKEASNEEFERLRLELERILHSLKVQAEAHFSRNPDTVLQKVFSGV